MKRTAIALVAAMSYGCMTQPKVEATKPWEGHCYTVEELRQKTDSIQLDENESIWIMSNFTVNRLLRNASGK